MTLQYKDQNIGPASFKHLKEDELLITKIFYTIQGEGPFAGQPAVFVRLAGCNRGKKQNMGCEFCDTDFRFANGVVKSFAEIIHQMEFALLEIIGVYDRTRPLVVITGGEPMMQNNLSAFIKQLHIYGWGKVQIETNGDRLGEGFEGLAFVYPYEPFVSIVVSPKVGKNGYKMPAIWHSADALKFIISSDPASHYYDVPKWAFEFQKTNSLVYIQPMTVYHRDVLKDETASFWEIDDYPIDREATRANFKRAAALAMHCGFRLSTQLHLLYEVE